MSKYLMSLSVEADVLGFAQLGAGTANVRSFFHASTIPRASRCQGVHGSRARCSRKSIARSWDRASASRVCHGGSQSVSRRGSEAAIR